MYNRITIIGYLGKDPESRTVGANNTTLTKFSVATSERLGNDKEGKRIEHTEWFNVECWGKLGEIAQNYLTKGGRVLITGTLRTETYKDKFNVDQKYTKVVAQDLVLLTPKGEAGERNPKRELPDLPGGSDDEEGDLNDVI